MISVAIFLQARPGDGEAVEDLFRRYGPIVEQEPGVVKFTLHRSRTTPERYLLFETYNDYAALTAHRHSPVFAEWRPQIAALETNRTLEEFDIIVG